MRYLKYVVLAVILFTLSSCSDTDYVNSIPRNSTMLMSMNASKISGVNNVALLKTMLHIKNFDDCGLDFSSKIYMFESLDGNLGFCMKVADDGSLTDMFNKIAKSGICDKVKERRGFNFTSINNSWVVGFSDKAMLVMGPVEPSVQAEMQNQMAKYLKQDGDNSIKDTPMFDKLDSLDAPMALVAQSQALPEKFVAPFTLGAPKDTEESKIMISAEMSINKGCLDIKGETFSFNPSVDKALKDALKIFRPIKGKYVKSMESDALFGMFMNVEGDKFLPLLQNNTSLQMLLSGINTAIDMDNIIRSINGDFSIMISKIDHGTPLMQMSAELANSKFLEDIDYWKKSCPAGSSITDMGKNTYVYSSGKNDSGEGMRFYFGVSDDKQFHAGYNPINNGVSMNKTQKPISDGIQQKIVGEKMCIVLSIDALESAMGSKGMGLVKTFMFPIFGNLNTVVYNLK